MRYSLLIAVGIIGCETAMMTVDPYPQPSIVQDGGQGGDVLSTSISSTSSTTIDSGSIADVGSCQPHGGVPIGELGPHYLLNSDMQREISEFTLCCLGDGIGFDLSKGNVPTWWGPDLWWLGSPMGVVDPCPPGYKINNQFYGYLPEPSDPWSCAECQCTDTCAPIKAGDDIPPWNDHHTTEPQIWATLCKSTTNNLLLEDPGTGVSICIWGLDRNACPYPWNWRHDVIADSADNRRCSPCSCE